MAKGQLLFMPACIGARTTRSAVSSTGRGPDIVPGLVYIPRYVSEPREALLLACIDTEPWRDDRVRRTQHYGRSTGGRRGVDERDSRAIPTWLEPLVARLVSDGHMDAAADAVTVAEDLPGHGVPMQLDRVRSSGKMTCTVSLGSSCVMEFLSLDGVATSLFVDRGSLLICSADARDQWKRGIAKRKSDTVNGTTFPRSRRVSLTFRAVGRRE